MTERKRILSSHLAATENGMTLPGQNERATGELGDETKTKALLTGCAELRKGGHRLLDYSVLDAALI